MLHEAAASPVMVGRDEEVAALRELLAAASAGHGRMALIGGDAGIGKSRICRELKALAARLQMRVIEGRCSPAESALPYAPFMDALRFRLSRGEGDAAAQVLQPILSHVAPLFSKLGENADNRADAGADAAPFERIFSTLHRLSGLGSILYIIEDIQWIDTTSRDLLHYIARRIGSLPMLFLVTYRNDELQYRDRVQPLVTALTRERLASRIELGPLDFDAVRAMLGHMLERAPEPELAVRIYDRTEGNPLFVEEYVAALGGDHDAAPPATLHDLVWERLAPLSNETREALGLAAVIGRRFRFDVLAAALGWPEGRLLEVIEDVVARRIVVELSEGPDESYGFRQSIIQEVLYASTIGRRRRLWHGAVARAIEAVGGPELPHTALAHHYNLSGDLQRARVHTTLAGDEAARLCAWRDAESMYEAALAALQREGGNAEVEADILERLAHVAWWQNHLAAYENHLRLALAHRHALGQRSRAAHVVRQLANYQARQRGDVGTAITMLHDALALLTDDDASARVFMLNDLGRLHLEQGEWKAAAEFFDRSLQTGGASGDRSEEAFSMAMLGWLAVHGGQVATGCERLELARALLAEQQTPFERAAEVYHAGIRALEGARAHRLARAWVDAALAYAQANNAPSDIAIFGAYQAAVQRRTGDWDDAIDAAAAAVAELRASGRAELREALRIMGDLQRGRGELQAARNSYEEALALGEPDAIVGTALLLMAEEKWSEAADSLQTALSVQPAADRLFSLRVLPLLIEAHCGAGAVREARAQLRQLADLIATSDYAPGSAALAQATANVLSAEGSTNAAVRELHDAVEGWRDLGLPYETARAQLLLAAQLIAMRRSREAALGFAREAAQTFETLGATLEVARAHRVLRLGGVRIQRRRRAAVSLPEPLNRLTARELEVFDELARGATNKQIARTLSLSPRTVGNHVSAILAKLGCATRTEAARFALLR